jgi:branched-chain amino acid aminotransferase
VTPVREIGPHNYQPGQISRQLMEDYGRLVRGQALE